MIADIGNANRYIEFLRRSGFGKRELMLISGDSNPNSESRLRWNDRKDGLSEPNVYILPAPQGRNYGPKTSLWIRPTYAALAKRHTGFAGFRYAMAMAYVVFSSSLPAPQ
jgi:hypothetical protein